MQNYMVCNCKQVSRVDIDRVLHDQKNFSDVEAVFAEVQKETQCSTGCGGCHDKIMQIISDVMHGDDDK